MASRDSIWQQVARHEGGTVAGLGMASSADGEVLVLAATSVGVFRSSDRGRTWTLPGLASTAPLAEVVVPSARFSQDRTIFVGTADGLSRSSDSGLTWQQVLVGSRMLSVACATVDGGGSLVLVGAEADGILRSEDAGRTWTGANPGLLDLTVLALGLSPQFASDRLGLAGTSTGLYRTRNGARSWRVVETGLEDAAVQCLAFSPAFQEDHVVLAGTEADGLLRSDDGGATWHRPPSLVDQGVTALAFATDYPTHRAIAAATESGIAVSRDGGVTWRTTDPGSVTALSLSFVARESGVGDALLAGLAGHGVLRSEDDGATWKPANAGLNARMLVDLELSPAFGRDETVFVAGPNEGVRISVDGGHTWSERSDGLDESMVFELAASPDYADDRTLYAATSAGLFVSRDAGTSWQPSPSSPPTEPPRCVTAARSTTGEALVLIATTAGIVLVSNDAARTWRALPAAFDGAEIISLEISPDYARDPTLFVATTSAAETVVWRSRDAGQRWERWLVEPGQRTTLPLAVSPGYAFDELVFAAVNGRVLKPDRHAREVHAGRRRPVWRGAVLQDGGVAATGLAVSPNFQHDDTLFAATSGGVFVSRDAGDTFSAWNEGFDLPRLVGVAISPDYVRDRLVYGLGLGGPIWKRRDDANPSLGGSGSSSG